MIGPWPGTMARSLCMTVTQSVSTHFDMRPLPEGEAYFRETGTVLPLLKEGNESQSNLVTLLRGGF